MSDAMYIGATGMQAQQLSVDTIANNLANVNTSGFKKGRVTFTDLMTTESTRMGPLGRGGASNPDGTAESSGLNTGIGVGIASSVKLFDAGTMAQTGSMWDLAVNGDGFLQLTMPDGTTQYTRGGTLKVNSDGQLVTQSGQLLKPAISIPANATNVAIGPDGTVSVSVPDHAKPVEVGQLQLAHFGNPSGLSAQGDNRYQSTDVSGEPILGFAGQGGMGTLQQGYLEGSNVKMVDEMVNLMVAQRAYEASVKVVQASDEMAGLVNNLRK